MKTKFVFTIITIIAIIGMATPAILDSAFAVKGDGPNDKAGLNPFKSCDKHDNEQKKCAYKPINDDEECVDTDDHLCDGGPGGDGECVDSDLVICGGGDSGGDGSDGGGCVDSDEVLCHGSSGGSGEGGDIGSNIGQSGGQG